MIGKIGASPLLQRIVAFFIAAAVALVLLFSTPGVSEAHKWKKNGKRHHHGKSHHGGKKVKKSKKVRRGNVHCKAVNVAGDDVFADNYFVCQRINA